MDLLTKISIIISIIVGILAILEVFFNIFSIKKKQQKILNDELNIWENSDYEYTMNLSTLNKIVGYAKKNKFDEKCNTFLLLSAIQHGPKYLNSLIEKNYNNKHAIPYIFNALTGKGVRVGWRAEHTLTKLNHNNVKEFIEKLPKEILEKNNINSSIERILNNTVIDYLTQISNSKNEILSAKSKQVLYQISSSKKIYEY